MIELIRLDEVDSTNSYIKRHIGELSDGCAVTARLQTAGRGRCGHDWAADEGMLPLSMLLVNPPERGSLTARAGLAVCEAIEGLCGVSASIKWPNDIIIGSHKVCGILCECVVFGDDACVIVGIGVNVSQNAAFFEHAGLPHAASLLMETGTAPSRDELACFIAENVIKRAAMPFAECYDEYGARLVNIGKTVRIFSPDGEITATAVDVAENGFLVCRGENGIFTVGAGEVSVRGENGYI